MMIHIFASHKIIIDKECVMPSAESSAESWCNIIFIRYKEENICKNINFPIIIIKDNIIIFGDLLELKLNKT